MSWQLAVGLPSPVNGTVANLTMDGSVKLAHEYADESL